MPSPHRNLEVSKTNLSHDLGILRFVDNRLWSAEIVEFSFHNTAVGQLVWAMSGTRNSGVHIRWQSQHDYREEIPLSGTGFSPFVSNAGKSRLIASIFFYWRVLFRIQGNKLIWISTGPESKVLPDLCFLLLIWVAWRKRIILSVRNIERWGCSLRKPTGQDRVRGWLISKIPRLVFESETQRRLFHSWHVNYVGLTSSLPVCFSDGKGFWGNHRDENSGQASEGQDLRLGLLGGLDAQRRDYGELISALAALEDDTQKRIVISIIGSSSSIFALSLIDKLRSLVKVETFESYISNNTLMRELSKSDVLVAPLRTDMGYGSYKGTGSLGDALIAQCKVLMPSGIQVDEAMCPAVIFYGSASDLTSLLAEFVEKPERQRIDAETLEFYNREQAFGRVIRDLALA